MSSMNTEIAAFAPIKVTVEFSLTDGNMVARAGFDCPPGELPSAADIERAASSVLAQVRDQLGEAFCFQTRHGFVSDLLEQIPISLHRNRQQRSSWRTRPA
ncbi:hypothetical protein [Sphingomonas sp. SORGH_AS_0879]|uniref:hypothetical protein n=1 Tax=Sphingomonas sp. SORGH_AS_0879 TaxID=3041790 RepID=UPI002780B32B|nr:hypothetical protein [Sphingomonas sp. SORGH_AS_0879]MDQ1230976.1 hypothetical protein [Sphingomonas sp. SORGH_AS_0879]